MRYGYSASVSKKGITQLKGMQLFSFAEMLPNCFLKKLYQFILPPAVHSPWPISYKLFWYYESN